MITELICDCGHRFIKYEIKECLRCPRCHKHFCVKCGSTQLPLSISRADSVDYPCLECGELLG